MKLITLRKITLILIIFVLGFGIGNYYGNYRFDLKWGSLRPQITVLNKESPVSANVDFGQFWTVWDKLSQQFVDREKIIPQKMMEGAIAGMIATLGDPYTVYLPPTANQSMKEDLQGSFEGIGAQLGLNEKMIVVIAPLDGTPAARAGVQPQDVIHKVNGDVVDGKSLPEVVAKIRGPKGTKVTLSLIRKGEKNEIVKEIVRDTIIVKSVIHKFIKNKKGEEVAYIKLSQFGERTDNEWFDAINKISAEKDKIKGVILDLRNNPGGFLAGSVFVASEFLRQGTKVVSQESTIEGNKIYYSNREGKLPDVPLIVLVNKGSASASEIVSGALKDNKRAKLIGEKTFGKGSVQEVEDLAGGAGLHITIAKWITPSGAWIHGKGIEPDIFVKNDEKKPSEDKQLDKAINELTK